MLSLAAANLTSGDSYSVIAQATDSAGNVGTSSPVAFTYCNRTTKAPPTVTITYPVNGTTYGINWTGTITGTASSNSGPGRPSRPQSVAIEDTTTNKWWNNTSFGNSSPDIRSGQRHIDLVPTPWEPHLSGNSYAVMAQATDSAGNIGTSSTVSFTYDVTPDGHDHLPVQLQDLRREHLDRGDHGHGLGGAWGEHQDHSSGRRGHQHQAVVERHVVQPPALRPSSRPLAPRPGTFPCPRPTSPPPTATASWPRPQTRPGTSGPARR